MALTKLSKLIQRSVCIYDVLALAPLALPFVAAAHLETLGRINALLGGQDWPVFEPIPLMMAQLLGVIGTGWTVWRWMNMSRRIGLFEAALRAMVAGILLLAFKETAQPILLALAIIEIVWTLALITVGSREEPVEPI